MKNPATGQTAAYEEVWRDEEAQVVTTEKEGKKRCVVLDLLRGSKTAEKPKNENDRILRGRVIRIGSWCQGIVKNQDSSVVVERWEWTGVQEGWVRRFRCGEGVVPCSATWEPRERGELVEGEKVESEEVVWTVVESYEW